MIIQFFYEELGVEMVFKIWWTFHLIFLLNTYVVTNVWIYWDTKENFSELHQLPEWMLRRNSRVQPREARLFTKRAARKTLNERRFEVAFNLLIYIFT